MQKEMKEAILWELRFIRWIVMMSFLIQAAASLAGATMLWCAINTFYNGQAFWSAVQTCLAFYNGLLFTDQFEARDRALERGRKLREMARLLP